MRLSITLLLLSTLTFVNAQKNLDYHFQKAQQFVENPGTIDSAVIQYEIVDSLATIAGDDEKIFLARSFMGTHFRLAGMPEKSISYWNDLLPHCTSINDSIYSVSGMAIATMYNDHRVADSLFQLSFAWANRLPEPTNYVMSVYVNYGNFLMQSGKYIEAANSYEKALSIEQNDYQRMITLTNLSSVLIITSNWLGAEDHILEAVRLAEQNEYKARNGMVGVHYAWLKIHQGDQDGALQEIDNSIEYLKGTNKKNNLSYALSWKIKLLRDMEVWGDMPPLFNELESMGLVDVPKFKSLHLANKIHYTLHEKKYLEVIDLANELILLNEDVVMPLYLKTAYKGRSKANAALGNINSAYQDLQISESISDKIYRDGQAQYVAGMEAKLKRKEQNMQINLLNEENSSQDKLLIQQRKALIGGAIALALISLLTFLLFRYLQQVNAQKKLIAKTLSEKDLLLREIHHRVKNNLQLVSSLLRLQGSSIDDETALKAITDGRARVRSMALIHQDLYNQENLTGINVKDYLVKLSSELVQTYATDSDKIKLDLNIDDLNLDVDTVVPLGLIINELVTNTLKYAFPNGEQGVIEITLSENNAQLHLQVKDNGIGTNSIEKSDSSFGMTLINALCKQLDGELSIVSEENKGMQTTILFKDYQIAES